MEHQHLDADTLEHLLAADRTAAQNEQLFHLLAVCPRCGEVGGWLLELRRAGALPPVFGLIDATLARSRAEAPQLLEELLPLAPEARLARLHADPHVLSWGLCELLVRRSCQIAPDQPAEALDLADFAVHVADRIAEDALFEQRWIYQLRSLTWAALGNAQRVLGDLTEADRSFAMSTTWWETGTVGSDDAMGYEAVLLDLKASLRLAQRRFASAIMLLDGAVELFLNGEHPDPHLAGKSLTLKALVLTEMAEAEAAILTLKKANGLIDPIREPRLLLCLHHNLADNLSKAGHHREASALLPDLKTLAATHGSAKDRLRLDWVAGRVATGLNEHELARKLLTRVRQTFLDDNNPFDAALVAVDLAISHLQQGHTHEVRELADEMLIVFTNLQVAREPLAALLLFQEAAQQDRATADLARDLAATLARAHHPEPHT